MVLSVLTPTRNRAHRFPLAVECMRRQTWTDPVEWIIVEDGEQSVRTLLTDLPENVEVRYERLDCVEPIGKKRNRCVDLATGPICVFWDDDDFYHPEYLAETYKALAEQSLYGVVGQSILLVFSASTGLMYAKGKKGNFSACGVLAFTKSAVKQYDLRFNDEDTHGEERHFLKDFRVPILKRNPFKSIVAVQHGENTWNVKFKDDEKLVGYKLPDWALEKINSLRGNDVEKATDEETTIH
jgi:glycosyltransferase involved in cell wall biosynthesis